MSIPGQAQALLIAGIFAATPVAAEAQIEPASNCDGQDAISCPSPPPKPEPETPRPHQWTVTASAGITARDDGPNGTYQAISLTRGSGRAYLRAGLMRYHGTLLQADTALPSDYLVGTIAGGGNFDNWVADGWVSYGRQDYGKISTQSGGERESTGARDSAYYALGGDFGRILTLAPNWFLTPTVAGSFAHGKLLRPAPTGSGLIDLETDEPTWSGNVAIRIDHAFGATRGHYVGLSLSRNWTSNAVSQVRFGSPQDALASAPSSLSSEHFADSWFEIGMTANMRLTGSLALDIHATRSFDALAGNTSSTGLALRQSF